MSEIKVLYIGDFCSNGKTTRMANDNVLGLIKNGVNVVCKTIIDGKVDQEIAECFNNTLDDITHCIQHVPTEYMIGSSMYKKNIGIIDYEGGKMYDDVISRMDEIWHYNNFLDCGKTIYPSFKDKSFYNMQGPSISIKNIDNTYKFYTTMNYSRNKNVEDLLTAFYLTFDETYPVSLIIKLRSKDSEKDLFDHISKISEIIKSKIGKISYPKEIIMCGNMEDEKMASLHRYCDCFVNTSSDFGIDYNTLDAVGFGSQIITHNNSVYHYSKNANLVESINHEYKDGYVKKYVKYDILELKNMFIKLFTEGKKSTLESNEIDTGSIEFNGKIIKDLLI
jgi:hypothetical protein